MTETERDELLRKIDARLEMLETKLALWEVLAGKFLTGPGKRLAKMMGMLP